MACDSHGESGRQSRPTEPEHGTLRCIEVDDSSDAPGPGREGRFSVVSAPVSIGGPPGIRADGPGKFVDFVPRVGSEFSSLGAAIFEAIPALENGDMFGRDSETQQPARQFSVTLVSRSQKSRRNSNEITHRGREIEVWQVRIGDFLKYLATSQKRCKIGTSLLWKANRNSYALYRMTLNDLG